MVRSFLLGLGMGVSLTYLLDPVSGTQRRDMLRDRLNTLGDAAGDWGDWSRDNLGALRGRLQGLAGQVSPGLVNEVVDDELLADRVRQAIGNRRGILIDTRQGEITLRGQVQDLDVDNLITAVEGVRGVRAVVNQLRVAERKGPIPAPQQG
jgi:hypothetical protein